MIELGDIPVKISVSPCNVAPRAFSTNSEGTISGLAGAEGAPIVLMDEGAEPVVCAVAVSPPTSIVATAKSPAIRTSLACFMSASLV